MQGLNEGLVGITPSYLAFGGCLFAASFLIGVTQYAILGQKKTIGMRKWDRLLESRDKDLIKKQKEIIRKRKI